MSSMPGAGWVFARSTGRLSGILMNAVAGVAPSSKAARAVYISSGDLSERIN